MEQNIFFTARRLRCHLHNDLSAENLQQYLNANGWRVLHYNFKLFAKINCMEVAQNHHSFCFYASDDNAKIVFVDRENLSTRGLELALLHEVCHIVLNHHLRIACYDYNDVIESEANTLAAEVQRQITARPWRIRFLSFMIAVLLIVSLFNIPWWPTYSNQRAVVAYEPDSTTVSVAANIQKNAERFYITASGTRYHILDCYHIRGRDVFTISKSEAENMGYTPCKDCIGK